MPATSWTNEVGPGQSTTYNDELLTYNATDVYSEAGTPRYNQIGVSTSWTLESK